MNSFSNTAKTLLRNLAIVKLICIFALLVLAPDKLYERQTKNPKTMNKSYRRNLSTCCCGKRVLLWLFAILFCAVGVKAQNYPTFEEEREALIAFYEAMDGDHWTHNDNWCSDKPLSEWYGIELLESNYQAYYDNPKARGHIYRINLWNNNISGTIPACIFKLTSMYILELRYNNLTGEIPAAFAQMPNLYALDLSHNQLTGTIPAALADMPSLSSLNLGYNQLTGTIPEALGNMPKLCECVLCYNQLTGEIPAAFSNMKQRDGNAGIYAHNMIYGLLDLRHNQLTGNIPVSFVKLLDRVDQSTASYEWPLLTETPANEARSYDNSVINETIDGELTENFASNCPWIYVFSLNDNNLSGDIPEEIASHPKWNCYPGWESLNQNPGYGFNIASARLSVPEWVQCTTVDGDVFNKQSFKAHPYTLFISTSALQPYNEHVVLPDTSRTRCYEKLASISRKYGSKGFHICLVGALNNPWETYRTYGFGNIDTSYFTFVANGDDINPLHSWYTGRFQETFGEEELYTLFLFDQDANLVFHAKNCGSNGIAHLEALEEFLETKYGVCEEVFPQVVKEVSVTHDIVFSNLVDGGMDLSNTTIGDVYFRLDSSQGNHYDANRKGIVITSVLPTEVGKEWARSKDGGLDLTPGSNDALHFYNGIMIPISQTGSYNVVLEAESKGRNMVCMKLGDDGCWGLIRTKSLCSFNCYVDKPTYLYICANDVDVQDVPPLEGDENSITIYSVKIIRTTITINGIDAVEPRGMTDNIWYSLDGRRLQGKPMGGGIYIHNGRKIVVK